RRNAANNAYEFAAFGGGDFGGVPNLTLGTSNIDGGAATYVRTDATLALFDATVPAAHGTAAAGAAAVAARRDHVHPAADLAAASTTGTLPVSKGGTNSSVALSVSSTIMVSNGIAIVQGAAGTATTVLHGNAAGQPAYSAVSLTADVSGILGSANGGTANGFTAFSGPADSAKTFTLPDANATILTTNTPVTVAQGGTGLTGGNSGGVPYFSGAAAITASAALAQYNVLIGGGAGAAPYSLGSIGNSGEVLTSAGAGANPSWAAIPTSALLSATHADTQAAAVVRGDLIVGNATPKWSRLAKGTQYQTLQGGASDPEWGAVALGQASAVSGILGSANGGTSNGFAAFTGPTTSAKTFILPDADAIILTTYTAVTVVQGGTGLAAGTPGGLPYYSAANAMTSMGAGTAGQALLSGAGGAPSWGSLNASNGGTGLSGGYAVGDMLYASAAGTLSKLPDVAVNSALISGGEGVAPSYGKIGLTTHVSGILPIANGGTNSSAALSVSSTIMVSNGLAIVQGAAGTVTTVLHGNAAGQPTYSAVSLTADVTGVLSSTNGGTSNGFTAFTGPTTSSKTFTLPNADAIILTTYTAVTVAQGGTGLTAGTPGGLPYYSAAKAMTSMGAGTAGQALLSGAGGAPSWGTLGVLNGGTGLSGYDVGDILYASAVGTLSRLADIGEGSALISGGIYGPPSYGKIGLTTHVSGILGSVNGGTANQFTAFTGPTTSAKTFILPDADAIILTTNTPVTVAQGGTGTSNTLSGVVLGGNPMGAVGTSNANEYLRRNAANNAYEFGALRASDIPVADLGATPAIALFDSNIQGSAPTFLRTDAKLNLGGMSIAFDVVVSTKGPKCATLNFSYGLLTSTATTTCIP
ncbi:MAG TPA: hypothetical protein DCL44_06535, partial [Elusimicrobia bacterium]|nr:hypothetical protein [Elusimicrobiota bacterium]